VYHCNCQLVCQITSPSCPADCDRIEGWRHITRYCLSNHGHLSVSHVGQVTYLRETSSFTYRRLVQSATAFLWAVIMRYLKIT
jgi:hypothetical protein